MTETESINPRPSDSRWDGGIVILLALALLAAGWLDVRSFLGHRSHLPPPDFVLMDPLNGEPMNKDELYRHRESFVLLHNVGELEDNGKKRFRQGLGPRSLIVLSTLQPHARLDLTYDNQVEDQDLTVSCNDQVIEQFHQPPVGAIRRQYPLTLRPGWNSIALDFTHYGGVAKDKRPMTGGVITRLDLTLN